MTSKATPDDTASSSGQGNGDVDKEQPKPVRGSALVEVPFARVVDSHAADKSYTLTYIVIIALLAGLLGWIGWTWWQSRGMAITIGFEQPHGLQAGAALKLNGVQVGEVKRVSLIENQTVLVHARLTADDEINAMIAREGTQFWIPQFTADLARGLRNVGAVFASEIAIRPGTGSRRTRFVGLSTEPANVWLREGELPVVLRADRNHGVTEGSAVFYRGLQIGEIVRTQLSRDSSRFEAWLRIFAEYRDLIRKDSRFVDSSGVDFDFWSMSLNVDSLQSVIGGSVQLFTPTAYGPPAEAGREFELEVEGRKDYYAWSPYIEFAGYQSMLDGAGALAKTPILTKVTLAWKYPRALGLIDDAEGTHQGLVLSTTHGVLAPLSLMRPPQESATQVELNIAGQSVALSDDMITWQGDHLVMYRVQGLSAAWSADNLRHPPETESCTIHGPAGLHKVLNKEYLVPEDGGWRVTRDGDFNSGWHGAAVASNKDGRIIGLLEVDPKNRASVCPVPPDTPFLRP